MLLVCHHVSGAAHTRGSSGRGTSDVMGERMGRERV